jgi:hypothetical protein
MSVARVVRDLLLPLLLEGSDDEGNEPGGGPPPGSPPTCAQITVSSLRRTLWLTQRHRNLSTRQIRRPLVHNPACAINEHWIVLFPGLLILQDEVAVVICSTNKAERQDPSQTLTVPFIVYPGFSPHEAHAHQAFFGWILPTIRTSEFTILQIVGLDAAVVSHMPPLRAYNLTSTPKFQLLSFFKMSFYLFSVCSIFAVVILMPINLKVVVL